MLARRLFTPHGTRFADPWSKQYQFFARKNNFWCENYLSIAGGKVVERGVGISCCGDEVIGEAYNENNQICCFQRPDVNVYDRETPVSCLYTFVVGINIYHLSCCCERERRTYLTWEFNFKNP